jgi:hypothetical protein
MSENYKVEIKPAAHVDTEAKKVENKVCKIKVVRGGFPDTYIKVTPASHETEEIWTDYREGEERWKNIQRIINLHASRNAPIPAPVPTHNDKRDLRTPTLVEADIPTVTLENYVLTK